MTKLYTVTCQVEYIIAVEEDEDEMYVARSNFREACNDMLSLDVDMDAVEITKIPTEYPGLWDANCYPYGNSITSKSIIQILEENLK